MQSNSCRKCKEPVEGNYCPNCGQPAQLKRIDGHYFIQEIASIFNAERGIVYTTKKMLTTPGDTVRQFIAEDRSRYVKPVTFLITASLIFTLAHHFFHFDISDLHVQSTEAAAEQYPTLRLFFNWMINYHGYTSILVGFLVAFWVKLFFRKSGYNIFEVFTLMCFILGIGALISSVVVILEGLTHLSLVRYPVLFSLIYFTWAIGQFFDKKKAASYIKALLSCILGFYTWGILGTFIAIFIDSV